MNEDAAQGEGRYYILKHRQWWRASEAMWAIENAAGIGQSRLNNLFFGDDGWGWPDDPARIPLWETVLRVLDIPIQRTNERGSSPWVEPVFTGHRG